MAAMTITRKARRGKRAALLGAAAVMTVGLSVPAVIPDAKAALTLNAVTTGPLFRIADALGLNSVDITTGVSALDPLTISLAYTNSDPVNLNNKINLFPFGGFTPVAATFKRQPGGTLGAAILAGSGQGAYNSALAYQALLSSAQGNTLPGYSALEARGRVNSVTGVSCTSGLTCVQGTNVTNLAVLLVNNPGTPNGGLYARFAPILNLFGINPVTPGGTSASSTGIALNAATVGLALGYNALSDFPATLNPFSIANSLLATVLPTYLLGGGQIEGDSLNDIYTKLGLLATLGISSSSYSTFVPNDLPLLEPLRLPVRIINAVLNAVGVPITLGTPLAAALQPALTILVNTGYTDVQTPSEGGTYDRTYDQSGVYTPFLSKAPLTPAQWLAVPRNFITSLVYGFQLEFPLLRFGRGVPTLTATPGNNYLSITYTPAASGAAAPKSTLATAAVTSVPATAAFSVASSPPPTVQAVTVKTASTGGVRHGTTTKAVPPAASATQGTAAQATSADAGGSRSAPKGVGGSERAKAGNSAKKPR